MYSEGLLYSQRCPCSGEKFIFEKKRQLKLYIFELKKLPTEGGKDSKIMEWMRFLSGKKKEVIIPGLFEPPVRTLRATIPENESHIFR